MTGTYLNLVIIIFTLSKYHLHSIFHQDIIQTFIVIIWQSWHRTFVKDICKALRLSGNNIGNNWFKWFSLKPFPDWHTFQSKKSQFRINFNYFVSMVAYETHKQSNKTPHTLLVQCFILPTSSIFTCLAYDLHKDKQGMKLPSW